MTVKGACFLFSRESRLGAVMYVSCNQAEAIMKRVLQELAAEEAAALQLAAAMQQGGLLGSTAPAGPGVAAANQHPADLEMPCLHSASSTYSTRASLELTNVRCAERTAVCCVAEPTACCWSVHAVHGASQAGLKEDILMWRS